jgi:hypothetical protein
MCRRKVERLDHVEVQRRRSTGQGRDTEEQRHRRAETRRAEAQESTDREKEKRCKSRKEWRIAAMEAS